MEKNDKIIVGGNDLGSMGVTFRDVAEGYVCTLEARRLSGCLGNVVHDDEDQPQPAYPGLGAGHTFGCF